VSRVVNREFVLKGEEKEEFVGLMRLYEEFSRVKVLTYCVMSNHFHILVEGACNLSSVKGTEPISAHFLSRLGITGV